MIDLPTTGRYSTFLALDVPSGIVLEMPAKSCEKSQSQENKETTRLGPFPNLFAC